MYLCDISVPGAERTVHRWEAHLNEYRKASGWYLNGKYVLDFCAEKRCCYKNWICRCLHEVGNALGVPIVF